MAYSNIEPKMTPSMILEGGSLSSQRIRYAIGGRVKKFVWWWREVGVVVWCKPILVFSLSLSQAEQLFFDLKDKLDKICGTYLVASQSLKKGKFPPLDSILKKNLLTILCGLGAVANKR